MSKTGPVVRTKRRGGRRGSSSTHIGVALQELVNGLGIRQSLRQYDVITSWPAVVGEQVARVTEAYRMEKGVIYVRVASAPWRGELALRRKEIIEKINRLFGESIVQDIRFR